MGTKNNKEEVWSYIFKGDEVKIIGPFDILQRHDGQIKVHDGEHGIAWWIPGNECFPSKKKVIEFIVKRFEEQVRGYERNIARLKMQIAQIEGVEECRNDRHHDRRRTR